MQFFKRQRLKESKGFVLVFVMIMIMLLMLFMTAMVTTIGYTNRATAQKADKQQLQLTAQSAIGTLKDMFAEEENMTKLTSLIASGAVQDYDLSNMGVSNKVRASVAESGQPGYALLTVTAYDESGNEYTTTTLLPMVAAQGGKNDLIENMIVAYWPNSNTGFTQELTYDSNVMNGSIIIDNENYAGKYGDSTSYKNFTTNNSADSYAVRIKGGVFKELVTTGNLALNAEQTISGTGDTTIASAVGQLIVTRGTIGTGIKEIGAGGYFEDKSSSTTKAGSIVIGSKDNVNMEGNINIISRDKVNVTLNKVSGSLGNCFVGGALTYSSPDNGSAVLNVSGDLQVYKNAVYNVNKNGAQLNVAGDVASGGKTEINVNNSTAKMNVTGAVVTAANDIKITGAGLVNAGFLLSGKGITASSGTKVTLNGGNKQYSAFSGGNYGISNDYYTKAADSRGTTDLQGVTSAKPAVVNNKLSNAGKNIKVYDKATSQMGLEAFKSMNSLWLTKAQKVYKGGWWNSCKDIKFAVALLFDNTVPTSYNYYSKDVANKKDYSYITSTGLRYNPSSKTNTATDKLKNWQWYEMKSETYFGGKAVPVSHELGYTTNDSLFLLRSTLQVALGGPTDSTNLNINASSQGQFVDTARTAIPYDGAIDEIQVNYPHYANYEVNPQVNEERAGWASITEYKDGYLIGGYGSTEGYANFGRVDFRNDGQKLFDGTSFYDIGGKTLYFKTTSPILPGGWGDFYFTSDNGEIKLDNKIVIEYTLNDTDSESLTGLGYIRIFLDPSKKLILGSNSTVTGTNLGSVDVKNVDVTHNNFHYTSIMPELYIFCARPSEEAKVNLEIKTSGFKGYIVAPWSVINMRDVSAGKDTEVFRGIILCKNFVKANSGTYNHYKPLSFGYAMTDSVFVLPESE